MPQQDRGDKVSYISYILYKTSLGGPNYWGPKELLRIFKKFPVKPKVSIDIKPQKGLLRVIYTRLPHTQMKGLGGNSERS